MLGARSLPARAPPNGLRTARSTELQPSGLGGPITRRSGVPFQRRSTALDPFSGHLFCFRSKRGDYLKILYWDGSGLCLFAKRLERGKFVWPPIVDGGLILTPAQLALLLEAIDWRRTVAPALPARPTAV